MTDLTPKASSVPALETSDIQATVLRPRPKPYLGEYLLLRIGDVEVLLEDYFNSPALWRRVHDVGPGHTARLHIRALAEASLRADLQKSLIGDWEGALGLRVSILTSSATLTGNRGCQ